MKGLQLPYYDKEERTRQWESIKPGDKIIRIELNRWMSTYDTKIFTVIKRTPTGSLRLDNRELLKNFTYGWYIINDDIKQFLYNVNLENDVMKLIYSVFNDKDKFKKNATLELMLELKELLTKVNIDMCN